MNTRAVNISSDIFAQVKPSKLPQLKELIENGSKHAQFAFSGKNLANPAWRASIPSHGFVHRELWAVQFLNFTNQQVYDLLSKSVRIVENTEEYALYMLNEAFNDAKDKQYSTPPGTLRIYAKDLICFYNGKTWRTLSY